MAARIPSERLAETAARISRLGGVTHNYERQHAYNLWFTLTAPSPEALEQTLDQLRRQAGLEFHSLPALSVYKIRVQFDLADEVEDAATAPPPSPSATVAPLSKQQKELVRLLQEGLAAEREPFAAAAARLGWPVGQVVEQVRQWLVDGVIRRFGAVLRHHELGFRANGMVVFRLPPDRIDAAGRAMAARREVSHCYQRPPLPDFPYNLYAMTHGRSEEDVRAAAAEMARGAGAETFEVLFSVREFKKASMRYFVE